MHFSNQTKFIEIPQFISHPICIRLDDAKQLLKFRNFHDHPLKVKISITIADAANASPES